MSSGISLTRKFQMLGRIPTENALGGFAVKMSHFSDALTPQMLKATEEATYWMTGKLRDRIRKDSGGDMILSGVGRKGVKVGARYTMFPSEGVGQIEASGPLHFLERDTVGHDVQPGKKIRGRTDPLGVNRLGRAQHKKRQAMYSALFGAEGSSHASVWEGIRPMPVGSGLYRYSAYTKGTRGKGTWSEPIEEFGPKVPEIYQRALGRLMMERLAA